MKKLLVIAALLALGGCASTPDDRYGYGQPGYGQPSDPSQWRVVSVTPVPPGTGERVARETGSAVQYSSTPIPRTAPVYETAPLYEPAPVYVPQPAYIYPPVTFSLGLMLGRGWGGHRHHHRGHRRHR